jgi:hypothetical protein
MSLCDLIVRLFFTIIYICRSTSVNFMSLTDVAK